MSALNADKHFIDSDFALWPAVWSVSLALVHVEMKCNLIYISIINSTKTNRIAVNKVNLYSISGIMSAL